MRILVTKPEPPEKQGGMTIALERVISYLDNNDKLEIFYLGNTENNFFIKLFFNSTRER